MIISEDLILEAKKHIPLLMEDKLFTVFTFRGIYFKVAKLQDIEKISDNILNQPMGKFIEENILYFIFR